MRWVSRLVQVLLVVAVLGAIGVAVWIRVHRPSPYHFRTWVSFHDASHLPIGSKVVIAGVKVGEITALGVDGRLARVDLRLADGTAVYDDAWAEKKAESLFGDGYIEIHPGTESHRRIGDGEPIPRVEEGTSAERTLRSLDEAMPRVQETLNKANRFADQTRRAVDGPLTDQIDAIDRKVRDPSLTAPLERADDAMTRFAASTDAAADATARYAPKVLPALDAFDRRVTSATRQMKDGETTLKQTLGDARTKIDQVDPYIDDAAELIARVDGKVPPKDQGTLGRLVNDPELGQQIADVSDSGARAIGSLTRLRSYVGLRTEYDLLGRRGQVAIGLRLAGRHDSYYVLEATEGQPSLAPDTAITETPQGGGVWVRTATINELPRFTVQWGRTLGGLDMRFGLFENDFGVGVDRAFLGGQLELRTDVSLPSFARVPRVKLALAARTFESVYLMAGVDDLLLGGNNLPIRGAPPDGVPHNLEHVHYGRDLFVGGYLRFDDRDLDSLLLLYGAAIFAAL